MPGWLRIYGNRGGPGGDGVTLAAFAKHADQELARLARALACGQYRPGSLRQVDVPKRDGSLRRLKIPDVADRVVQSALLELLQPEVDRELSPASFGYRRGRGVKQAVAAVERLRDRGYCHVVDADIEDFFDSVPHEIALEAFGRFVEETPLAELVSLWLTAASPEGRGLPQGGPISPLLANLVLDDLDDAFQGRGMRSIRFADDFVILCRSEQRAEDALEEAGAVLAEKGLELNPEKTRIRDFDRGFRFLGTLFVRALALPSPERRGDLPERETLRAPTPPPTPPPAPSPEPPEPSSESVSDARRPALSLVSDEAALEDSGADADPFWPDAGFHQRPPRHGLAPCIRPLYLYQRGRRLDLRNQAFVVLEEEEEIFASAPGMIDRIEVGPEVEVSERAIRQAIDREIPLVFTRASGAPVGTVSGSIASDGKRHLAQAALCLDPARSLAQACAFTQGRLHNQKALLYRLNQRRHDPAIKEAARRIGRIALKLALAETADQVRGIEGEGASLYWPALSLALLHGWSLPERARREGSNPVAVVLDFASALVTRELEVLVLRHNLHPGMAVLHAARSSGSPCAWDLVEAFRAPLAEALTVYLFNNRILARAHFGRNPQGLWRLQAPGRERFLRCYEAWLNRTIANPRDGRTTIWRRLLDSEVGAYVRAIEEGVLFEPYAMRY